MKKFEPKNIAVKFLAVAAVGVSLIASPAFATQFYYAEAAPNSSELAGDVWTKYFSAKIHLVEYNGQLMLSKVALDSYRRQYVSEAYPIDFSFQGKGWSADLIQPIRMGINNSFHADGAFDSVIRANVNFTLAEYGRTETRPALATLHLVQSENFNHNTQVASLEIVDANDPSNVLYNSGTNLTMDHHADVLTSFLPLVEGRFDAKVFAQGNAPVAYNNPIYWNNAPAYSYNQPYVAPVYPTTTVWPNTIAMN